MKSNEYNDLNPDAGNCVDSAGKGTRIKSHPVSEDVLRALLNGDHQAFDIIFRSFYPRIKTFIASLLKSDEDAEELTQEIFVILWMRREQIDPSRNFNAYMYTMARNAALNFLKKKNLHETINYELVNDDIVASSEDEVFAREAMLLVKLTVSNMPEQRRRVYRMSRVENMTNDEIASSLDINKKVVERHLRSALSDIRETLQRFSYLIFLF